MGQIKYNLGDLANDFYSTTETVVGQWIDGKPIYRKVYENVNLNPNNSWQVTLDVSDLNADYITINSKSTFHITVDTGRKMSIFNAPTYFTVCINNGKLESYKNTTQFNYCFDSLILEYTKTTD